MAAATSRLQTASGPSSDTMMGTEPGTDSRQQRTAGGGCAHGSFEFCSKFSAIKCFTRFDTLHIPRDSTILTAACSAVEAAAAAAAAASFRRTPANKMRSTPGAQWHRFPKMLCRRRWRQRRTPGLGHGHDMTAEECFESCLEAGTTEGEALWEPQSFSIVATLLRVCNGSNTTHRRCSF